MVEVVTQIAQTTQATKYGIGTWVAYWPSVMMNISPKQKDDSMDTTYIVEPRNGHFTDKTGQRIRLIVAATNGDDARRMAKQRFPQLFSVALCIRRNVSGYNQYLNL